MALPSVQDLFYNGNEEPVIVVGNTSDRSRQVRRGYLSRQDSRNFRSSASPPPSRSHHHASSWFGHRKSSQSPPRYGRYQNEYSDYSRDRYDRSPERRSWFGTGTRSPTRYQDASQHTKYKEDYTGYPSETGYSSHYGNGSRYEHGYGRPGYSSDMYHGDHIPRTYQSPYAGTFNQEYLETIKLHVPLCCEACEERITNHMLALEGVESVTCDQVRQKVTVRGTASPAEVLRQGRECFKNTRFW
jgi:copper chaperone CopZ